MTLLSFTLPNDSGAKLTLGNCHQINIIYIDIIVRIIVTFFSSIMALVNYFHFHSRLRSVRNFHVQHSEKNPNFFFTFFLFFCVFVRHKLCGTGRTIPCTPVQHSLTFYSLIIGVTILLSLTVFLNMVAETMPETSDAVPLLGTRLTMICHQSTISTKQLNKPYQSGKEITFIVVPLIRD